MALVVSFTASSVAGEPGQITFVDTSTGSDAAVTSRRIYVSDKDGDFIVESGTSTEYEVWALPLATDITLELLTKDMATKIVVQWLDVSNVVLYDYTVNAQGFVEYNEEFDYELTQMLTGNPALLGDNAFWDNKSKLRTLIDSGNQAILNAADLSNAQLCYDKATELRLNSQYYFNENS